MGIDKDQRRPEERHNPTDATWNAIRAGIITGLAQHPDAAEFTPKDRQRIVDRAKVAYEAVLDSPEFRAELGSLTPEELTLFGRPLSRILEVMISEVVELTIEIVLIDKRTIK
jgi:hypothetical protein